LAGAAIAFTLDLLPEEQLVPEEFEAESADFTRRDRSTNPLLQSGLSLPDIELEPNRERAERTQAAEDLDVARVSRATMNLQVSASFVDSFFTSNQFVDTTPHLRVSPSPPRSTPNPSFSSSISQLGSGVGVGSGQGYNVTGAELPQSSVGRSVAATSAIPNWMFGEGEGGSSSTGSASASGSGSGDPSCSYPLTSVTIDPLPAPVAEMELITITGTVDIGYPDLDFGPNWVVTEYLAPGDQLDVTNWSMTGYFIDDGPQSIRVVGTNYCQDQALTLASVNVGNVAPTVISATAEPINEGETAVLIVQFTDASFGTQYASEEWTITVDWGDETSSSYVYNNRYPGDRTPYYGLGGANPPSSMPLPSLLPMEHTFHHPYPDDAYGDSPTPNEIANYPVTVTISDGTDSDIKDSIITVNNVAPTVTITSITPIDSVSEEKGGVDGRLDETEGFVVRGTVTDPGLLDTWLPI